MPRGATVIPPAGTAPGPAARRSARGTCSCCPARRASSRRSGGGRSSSSRSRPCASARARCCGTRCASTASASRPWRGPSRPPAATTAARARRSARARWRWRSRSARSPSARPALEALVGGLREQLGEAIYAEDERPLAELVLDVLRARGLHLAVAESCTAGLVAARLADIPGSSDVLLGGVIAYAERGQARPAGRSRGAARRVRRRLGRVRGRDGRGRARGDRRRGGHLRHGRGRPRRGQRAQAGRARLPARLGARRSSAGRSCTCSAIARRCANGRRSRPSS